MSEPARSVLFSMPSSIVSNTGFLPMPVTLGGGCGVPADPVDWPFKRMTLPSKRLPQRLGHKARPKERSRTSNSLTDRCMEGKARTPAGTRDRCGLIGASSKARRSPYSMTKHTQPSITTGEHADAHIQLISSPAPYLLYCKLYVRRLTRRLHGTCSPVGFSPSRVA